MSAALFPGQGVQAPNMDGGLTEAAPETFEIASTILNIDVAALCRTGRAGQASLEQTRWAQPAVLVCSIAAYRELERHEQPFTTVVGHSVGEYAALVAAKALSFEDAVGLIAARAEATADVAQRTSGAMAALLRVDIDQVLTWCAEHDVALAADNATGQCVISGRPGAIETAVAAASETRAMARRLDVEGAFHSPLMASAAGPLGDALSAVEIQRPQIAFWSSTTATQLTDPEAIRRSLLDQLTSCVRWRETVESIVAAGAGVLTDIGPGRVVGTLARRIAPAAEVRFATDLLPAGAPS